MKREALQAAAHWFVQLHAEDVHPEEVEAWRCWYESHPDHQWAWRHVETMQGQLTQQRDILPGDVANRAFSAVPSRAAMRRSTLKGLFAFALAGGGIYAGWRQNPQLAAQYRTATGEQRQHVLDDGSVLLLNTHTALDVDYSTAERRVRLHQGEVHIQTAVDRVRGSGISRPFIVETRHGLAVAMGTQFIIRQLEEHTRVEVEQSAVEIQPHLVGQRRIIRTGEQTDFSRTEIQHVRPLDENTIAWKQGVLIAENWPLDVFLAELARYRPGYLGWSSDLAALRISGVFPIRDTDHVLTAVAKSMPVRVISYSRYWTRVSIR